MDKDKLKNDKKVEALEELFAPLCSEPIKEDHLRYQMNYARKTSTT